MKKIFVLFCFLLSTLLVQAEKYSYIYFVTNNCSPKSSFNVYVGHRLIGKLTSGENLAYKIYSQGKIPVVIETPGVQIERFVTVENDKRYYFEINNKNLRYGMVETKTGEGYLAQNPVTIPAVEDLKNPVGQLPPVDETAQKQGTCFLVNRAGYLLTNYHVISNTGKVFIKGVDANFTDKYEAVVVAYDAELDLALLRFKDRSLQFGEVPYVLSEELFLQGNRSFVLGYPLTMDMGEEIKVTEGIVSANSGYKGTISQCQFSASVHPGNSGSPLFNEKGEIIGVINAKLNGAENTGYAIKSQYVSTFLKLAETAQDVEKPTPMTELSLPQKIQRIKRFVFIVVTE